MSILLAVSGGIDSMCLIEKVRLDGGPFAAAHCNFLLRGEESDADEQLVRDYCSRYGITLHVRRFETREYAAGKHISIEMAARELRYRWFGELCTEFGYEAVMVAHNAQDNAETLILNLLRGTGLKGMTGMREDGFLPVKEYSHIPLRRPLLHLTREEITEFAMEHGLSWREDSTNAENGYKRNKIRNLVFPVFRQINPSFVQTLNRDMERLSQLEEYIPERLRGVSVSVAEKCSGNTSPLRLKEYVVEELPWDGSLPVKQEGGVLIMDAGKCPKPEFSFRRPGDWLRPLGAPGKKKLQDWFTDHHVSACLRDRIPLVRDSEDSSHILAVAGLCIDRKVKVGKGTKRIWRIAPVAEK